MERAFSQLAIAYAARRTRTRLVRTAAFMLAFALSAQTPAFAQLGTMAAPVYGTPSVVGSEFSRGSRVVALGRPRGFVRILVQLEVRRACQMVARVDDVRVRCSQDIPFVAALVSDFDPEFEETVPFTIVADEWRPKDGIIPVTAQRLVVDY